MYFLINKKNMKRIVHKYYIKQTRELDHELSETRDEVDPATT